MVHNHSISPIATVTQYILPLRLITAGGPSQRCARVGNIGYIQRGGFLAVRQSIYRDIIYVESTVTRCSCRCRIDNTHQNDGGTYTIITCKGYFIQIIRIGRYIHILYQGERTHVGRIGHHTHQQMVGIGCITRSRSLARVETNAVTLNTFGAKTNIRQHGIRTIGIRGRIRTLIIICIQFQAVACRMRVSTITILIERRNVRCIFGLHITYGIAVNARLKVIREGDTYYTTSCLERNHLGIALIAFRAIRTYVEVVSRIGIQTLQCNSRVRDYIHSRPVNCSTGRYYYILILGLGTTGGPAQRSARGRNVRNLQRCRLNT